MALSFRPDPWNDRPGPERVAPGRLGLDDGFAPVDAGALFVIDADQQILVRAQAVALES